MIEKQGRQIAVTQAGAKVLVVDDEQDFMETLVKRLQHRGFDAAGVHDGRQALDLLGTESYDVVILDILMPGMGGLDVLREIKLTWPTVQVILLSGHGGEELGMRGMAYGAYAYLLKPASLNVIVEAISTAAEERALR